MHTASSSLFADSAVQIKSDKIADVIDRSTACAVADNIYAAAEGPGGVGSNTPTAHLDAHEKQVPL